MERQPQPMPEDADRKQQPQDVVGDEGGAGTVGNPSRVDKSGSGPREQSPVKPVPRGHTSPER